jgi:hypothetical protein
MHSLRRKEAQSRVNKRQVQLFLQGTEARQTAVMAITSTVKACRACDSSASELMLSCKPGCNTQPLLLLLLLLHLWSTIRALFCMPLQSCLSASASCKYA